MYPRRPNKFQRTLRCHMDHPDDVSTTSLDMDSTPHTQPQRRDRKLPDQIQNIPNRAPKIKGGLMGLERHEGETILTAKKWMLSIEGKVVIPPGAHMADFTTALAALFACYYVFNLEYQVEASTTLEFVQRFLVRINPDSNKCTAKEQMSKTTGRVVKRKTSYMNPHVISFIRDFTEFYLLTD